MKRAFTRNSSTWISRLLILTMVLALLVGTFAGCRKQEAEPSDEPDTPPGLLTDESKDPTDGQTEPEGETDPTGTEPVVIQDNIATITAEQVNVRAAPSSESTVIGTLVKGDKVEIVDQQTLLGVTWGKLADKKGWIPMDLATLPGGYVPPTEPEQNDETTPDETEPENTGNAGNTGNTGNTGTTGDGNTKVIAKGVITASELHIRSKAGTDGEIVGKLYNGDRVEILEKSGGWGRISKGWISLDYVYQDGTTGDGNTKVIAKGVITASELHIRSKAGTDGEIVGKLYNGDRVEILEKSGGWGRISKGWISLDYVYQDGTTGKNTAKGVVTGTQLNIRSGPGTNYGSNGSLEFGARVNILEQFTIDGKKWGCIDKGWISLDYVYIDGTTGEHSGTGVINVTDQLNIRSGPGTGYALAGSLKGGTEVKIYTQIKIGDTTWGCIDKGWISMDYVDMK